MKPAWKPCGRCAARVEQGYRPLVLERGRPVRERIRDVHAFDAGGPHDPATIAKQAEAKKSGETPESVNPYVKRGSDKDPTEAQAKNDAEGSMHADLVRKLVEAHQFELPERLVEHQTQHRFESIVRDMIGHGVDPRNPELQWDKARDSLKEQASYDLRSSLLLERIADEERIEVGEQEIEDEINAMAAASRQSPEQVRAVLTKQGGERSIASRLRNRKALDVLVANASVTDEEWKEEEE